jgi:hypothetical protein
MPLLAECSGLQWPAEYPQANVYRNLVRVSRNAVWMAK